MSLLTLANFFCTAAVEDWRRCDGLVLPDVSEYHSTFIIKCQENGSSCLNKKNTNFRNLAGTPTARHAVKFQETRIISGVH